MATKKRRVRVLARLRVGERMRSMRMAIRASTRRKRMSLRGRRGEVSEIGGSVIRLVSGSES